MTVTMRLFKLALLSLLASVVKGDQYVLGVSPDEHRAILARAAPILGYDDGCRHSAPTCDWQAQHPNNTKLVDLNLPGTHDAATWNYTATTQERFLNYTGPIPPADYFRCQTRSLFQQLNDGIRVFDLRYSWNPGNETIGFFHSVALLAPTTSLEDVFFGFYSWLSRHPTETVLISMKYESGPRRENNEAIQKKLYDIFNSKLGKQFWLQSLGHLGTLGQARGKMILLQRTPYDKLSLPLHQIGIPLPPYLWLDNDANILIPYNPSRLPNNTAHIEDFYQSPPTTMGLQANVDAKVDAVLQHLQLAIDRSGETKQEEHFWITFASATQIDYSAITPRMMALGEGSVKGVDQRLLDWAQEHRGTRLGAIMLDFYEVVPGLIEAILGTNY